MSNFQNKWILVGSLGIVFFITLGFSYGPGYGGYLSAFLNGGASISPKMSPSDTVTPMVTSKKLVTLKSVTNVTSVSPTLSPITYNDGLYTSVSPIVAPVPSRTPIMSPTPLTVSSVSPSRTPPPTMSPSPTVTPLPAPPIPTPTQIPSPSSTPTQIPLLVNNTGAVVINEIAWMGTGGTAKLSNDEWIELYNTTNQTIDLTGWTLKSLTGTAPDPQITLAHSIQPFGFYLLERTDDTTVSDVLADQIYTGPLLDTGENLELKDPSDLLIDAVSSEGLWYAGDKDGRSSMERINPGKTGQDSTNWGTNNGITKNGHNADGNPINGTPASVNSVYGL